MDKKDNDYCAGIDACSIWHHVGLVCGFEATLAIVWQGIQKHFIKYWYGLIVALIMIVFVFFYDRSQLNIGTILYQLVYSFCVDLFADAHVYSSHLWLNAVIMILGVMLFAVGTGFLHQRLWGGACMRL